MEDVLEVYHRPYDPLRPVVCLDEASMQLIEEVRAPLAPSRGHTARYDSEYVRNGVSNLFMAFEPLGGWRHVAVTDRRRRIDWAFFVKDLVDVRYAEAEKVVLVMDQLNTHSPASLYEAFEPAEAQRIAKRLEIHHTPKHGSWLGLAESELSALVRDLGERVGERSTLVRHVAAWQAWRNGAGVKANWQFTAADARIKLRKLYPPTDA